MPLELYIQRDSEIPLEEWRTAVTETEGLRLDENDIVATNPRTGEEIRIVGKPGSARVYNPAEDQWVMAFRHSPDLIFFHAPDDWEEKTCYMRPLAFGLARRLGAQIIDEEERPQAE